MDRGIEGNRQGEAKKGFSNDGGVSIEVIEQVKIYFIYTFTSDLNTKKEWKKYLQINSGNVTFLMHPRYLIGVR